PSVPVPSRAARAPRNRGPGRSPGASRGPARLLLPPRGRAVTLRLHLTGLLPFAAAAAAPALPRRFPRAAGWLLLPLPAAIFASLLVWLPRVAAGETPAAAWAWVPAFGFEFSLALDGFGLLFGLLIAGIGTLVVAYAQSYLGPDEDRSRFYLALLLFMGAMLGVVL